jgi:hypothetical protein
MRQHRTLQGRSAAVNVGNEAQERLMTDWRLQGQESYLKNAELWFCDYEPFRAGWEHDHCEFCSQKIAVTGGDFTKGYATIDRYHWICENCFEDFKDQFGFSLRG